MRPRLKHANSAISVYATLSFSQATRDAAFSHCFGLRMLDDVYDVAEGPCNFAALIVDIFAA